MRNGSVPAVLVVGLAVGLMTGCIEMENRHTIYVDPEGGVTWSVLSRDIRSTESDHAKRATEEAEFLLDARSGETGAVRALRFLGDPAPTVRLIREERPFVLLTEARYDDVADLTNRILLALGVVGDVEFTTSGRERTLSVVVELDGSEGDGDDTIWPLVAELADYEIVLTDGRFSAVTGFELSDDRRVARPIEVGDEVLEELDRLELSLSWRIDR